MKAGPARYYPGSRTAIAGTTQNTPHDFLYTETLNKAIWSDPGWNGGEYTPNEQVVDGLKRHAHIWGIMEQQMIPNSELRVVEDIGGHLGLFAIAPTYMPQIDEHLGDLLATEV